MTPIKVSLRVPCTTLCTTVWDDRVSVIMASVTLTKWVAGATDGVQCWLYPLACMQMAAGNRRNSGDSTERVVSERETRDKRQESLHGRDDTG